MDISRIKGTGPDGVISSEDVLAADLIPAADRGKRIVLTAINRKEAAARRAVTEQIGCFRIAALFFDRDRLRI